MDKGYNLEAMKDYLNDATNPMQVAKVLDEVVANYTQLILSSDNGPSKNDSSELYELRALRNVFMKIGGCNL